jgi:hypothetical protein
MAVKSFITLALALKEPVIFYAGYPLSFDLLSSRNLYSLLLLKFSLSQKRLRGCFEGATTFTLMTPCISTCNINVMQSVKI